MAIENRVRFRNPRNISTQHSVAAFPYTTEVAGDLF